MTQDDWRGDWRNAEKESLRAGLAATPEQRLEWLQAALEFVHAARAPEVDPPKTDPTPRHEP